MSNDDESRRIYGTIQDSSTPLSVHVQRWTVIATKEKVPLMSLGVLPSDCSAHDEALTPMQSLLINLHNGCVPNMTSITDLLQRHRRHPPATLAPLCVYIEATISVSMSHKCYIAILNVGSHLDFDEEFAELSSIALSPHSLNWQSRANPIIPRLLLCLTSNEYVAVEKQLPCIRDAVVICHSYAILRFIFCSIFNYLLC